MNRKETLAKLKSLNIEQKAAMLSETEQAYVLGFIDGANWNGKNGAPKPKQRKEIKRGRKH